MADSRIDSPVNHQVSTHATQARLWLTACAFVLLGVGILAGVTLDRHLMGQSIPANGSAGSETQTAKTAAEPNDTCVIKMPLIDPNLDPESPEIRDAVALRVKEILKLDSDQQHQVRAIIEKYNPRIQDLRHRFEPELHRLALDALGDLRRVLNDDQKRHLDVLLGKHGRWLLKPSSQPAGPR